MVIAVAEVKGQAFRWNLSSSVGSGQINRLDDVELVRFGYNCLKQNKKFPPSAALLPALRAMKTFGEFDQDLADVIVAHQKDRGGTQDGIVSVANVTFTSTNRELYDRKHSWIIIALCNNMIDVAGDVYPRVDKHPESGPEISRSVKSIFGIK